MAIAIFKFPKNIYSVDSIYFLIALFQGLFLIYITPEIAKYVLPKINECVVSDFDSEGEAIGTRVVRVDETGDCAWLPDKVRLTQTQFIMGFKIFGMAMFLTPFANVPFIICYWL